MSIPKVGEVMWMVNRVDSNQWSQVSTTKTEGTMKIHIQKTEHNQKNNDEELSFNNARSLTDSINKFLQSTDSHLRFEFHEELSEYYVTIVNTDTDEVIREIPSKKLLDVHAAMKEFVGLLVDQKI